MYCALWIRHEKVMPWLEIMNIECFLELTLKHFSRIFVRVQPFLPWRLFSPLVDKQLVNRSFFAELFGCKIL